jgi:tRNA dimethylallyltransferase
MSGWPAAVAIFGPTGIGKTELALRVADRWPTHLISCDAVVVYRELRAATAKPHGRERRHGWALVDISSAQVDFNLGDWVRQAEAELRWAKQAGRIPLIVGGTGMYLRGLVKGVSPAPRRDPELRARLHRLIERHGASYLHRVLRRLDLRTAARLGANDRQRIARALEVRLGARNLDRIEVAGDWTGSDRFPLLRIGLTCARERLYPRLDQRVERFFDDGLVAEVQWLLSALQISGQANALRAIGYREVAAAVANGTLDGSRSLVELVQRRTRQYAKRQWTWFRSEPQTEWIDTDQSDPFDRCCERIARWCGL